MRLLVGALLGVLILSGCSATPKKDDLGIKVDSPELRSLKSSVGMADCPEATGGKAAGDKVLPDITLPCLGGGRSVALRKLRGPMVISLWAQWCANCPQELEWFQAISQKYAEHLTVLGIDWQDPQPGAALKLAGEKGATFPSLADPGGLFRNRGLPRLVMIDAQGHVVYDHYGELSNQSQLEDLIAQHLEVHP